MVSIFNSVWITAWHVLLFEQYVAHHQKEAEMMKVPRLLDQLRAVMRARHYSPGTEETYINWGEALHLLSREEASRGDGC